MYLKGRTSEGDLKNSAMKSLYVRAAKTGLLLALLVSLVAVFSDIFSSLSSAKKSNSAPVRFLHRRLPETDIRIENAVQLEHALNRDSNGHTFTNNLGKTRSEENSVAPSDKKIHRAENTKARPLRWVGDEPRSLSVMPGSMAVGSLSVNEDMTTVSTSTRTRTTTKWPETTRSTGTIPESVNSPTDTDELSRRIQVREDTELSRRRSTMVKNVVDTGVKPVGRYAVKDGDLSTENDIAPSLGSSQSRDNDEASHTDHFMDGGLSNEDGVAANNLEKMTTQSGNMGRASGQIQPKVADFGEEDAPVAPRENKEYESEETVRKVNPPAEETLWQKDDSDDSAGAMQEGNNQGENILRKNGDVFRGISDSFLAVDQSGKTEVVIIQHKNHGSKPDSPAKKANTDSDDITEEHDSEFHRTAKLLVGTGSLDNTGSLDKTEALDKARSFTRALVANSIESELSHVDTIHKQKAQVHEKNGRRFSGDNNTPRPFKSNKFLNSERDDNSNDASKNSTNANPNNDINYTAQHNASKAPKTLIYHCPIEVKCGGLADRLKGIVLGYILAYVTGRHFRILMPLPGCKLSNMLKENSISWRMTKEDDLKFLGDEGKSLIYTRMNSNSRFQKELTAVNYREYFGGADVVYFRTNVERFKWLFSNPYHSKDLQPFYPPHHSVIYRTILNQLFKLAPPLQAEVNAVLNKVRTSNNTGRPSLFVCAQVRTGRNPSMPMDSNIRVTSPVLPTIWDFMKKQASGFSRQSAVSFFVSSDSEQILEEARKVFGKDLLQVGGRIVHVDQPLAQDDLCPGMRRVLVDMHVLTSCDVLLLTRSGVGDLAADLRGTEQGLYCLNLHTLGIEKCRP